MFDEEILLYQEGVHSMKYSILTPSIHLKMYSLMIFLIKDPLILSQEIHRWTV